MAAVASAISGRCKTIALARAADSRYTQGTVKLATRRRRIALPGGGAVSAVIALPPRFRPGRTPAVIIAHGAGTDMAHPFLSTVHTGLARAGWIAVKFNFPYTEARRRVPDPRPTLERCYGAVLDAIARDRALRPPWVAIGGKSLGGRIASYLAVRGAVVRGCCFLGYPLHPTGKPDRLRADHLPAIPVPLLFVQGTRDALCEPHLLAGVLATLPRATLHSIPEADHSFRVPRRTGRLDAEVWSEITAVVAGWLATL